MTTLRTSDPLPRQAEGKLGATAVGGLAQRITRLPPLFLLIVVVPTLLATFYYFVLAAPVYVSQAQFIVRASSPQIPSAAGGFTAVLQGVGLAPAATDSFVVQDYIMSRAAIAALDRNHALRDALGRSPTDFLTRFPHPFETPSAENLALAYPRFVSVNFNSSSGISTLEVRAFRPEDARAIAQQLLAGGDQVVNHLNDRADQDAVNDTQSQIVEAEAELAQAEQKVTAFRNQERLIDPTKSLTVNLELMGKIQGDLAQMQAERASIAAVTPLSPQLPALDSRIRAYEQQEQLEQARMAGQSGSLAPMIGEYERLMLERDFADKTLANAATAAQEARVEARRKRLYLEMISSPDLPDTATEPHRWSGLITIVVALLLVYGTVALILAGLREHRQS